jgi:DNA-binding Lrp family transcriptional regulator
VALAERVKQGSRAYLKTRTVSQIIAVVDRAVARLLDPADPWRQQADRLLPLVTGFDAEMVRLGLTAYLNVRLEKHTESHKRNPMDLFRASVLSWPEVVECAALTGEMDFQLRLMVADMAAYSRFMMDTLLKHPSVQDCKTSFVMDRVKSTTALPV